MNRRINKTGRSYHGPPYVKLEHWILKSPAYLGLSAQARAILIELALIYNGVNNGSIGASVRRLSARCNIGKDTAAKCLIELQEAGFIQCTQKGAFSYKARHASEWRLTWLACNITGREASKLFMRPRSEKENAVPDKGHSVLADRPSAMNTVTGCGE